MAYSRKKVNVTEGWFFCKILPTIWVFLTTKKMGDVVFFVLSDFPNLDSYIVPVYIVRSAVES